MTFAFGLFLGFVLGIIATWLWAILAAASRADDDMMRAVKRAREALDEHHRWSADHSERYERTPTQPTRGYWQ